MNNETTPIVTAFDVPPRCSRHLHRPSDVAAFTISNFLDATECEELTHRAASASASAAASSSSATTTGFHYVTEATHTDDDGITHIVKLQQPNQHKLSVFEHSPTLERIWNRMHPILLPHIAPFIENTNCGPPRGLNPRLRVLRYDAIDKDIFQPHFDATTKVNNLTSLLTVLIYLNDGNGIDFDGGETYYLDYHTSTATNQPRNTNTNSCYASSSSSASTKITPKTGTAVIFEHNLYHSSVPLIFGIKYVLRTDILFEYDGDIDKPRGKRCSNTNNNVHINNGLKNTTTSCNTLLEICQELLLPEEEQSALEEIGLLDLTLDSLFAPGVSAVRDMLCDVMEEQFASRLLQAALEYR